MKFHNGIEDKTTRQLEEMENLIEKRTRTERHLENCKDIVSPEQKAHAQEIQEQREQQIENIKQNIANTDDRDVERENLRDNFASAQDYLEDNASHISSEMIKNMEKKQEHRKEQMNNYQ